MDDNRSYLILYQNSVYSLLNVALSVRLFDKQWNSETGRTEATDCLDRTRYSTCLVSSSYMYMTPIYIFISYI